MTRWRWCPAVFADGHGAGGHGRNGTGFGTTGYAGDGFGSPFFESGDGHSNNGSLDAQEFFVFLLGGKLVGHDD